MQTNRDCDRDENSGGRQSGLHFVNLFRKQTDCMFYCPVIGQQLKYKLFTGKSTDDLTTYLKQRLGGRYLASYRW